MKVNLHKSINSPGPVVDMSLVSLPEQDDSQVSETFGDALGGLLSVVASRFFCRDHLLITCPFCLFKSAG
jgi:hypothetical protein